MELSVYSPPDCTRPTFAEAVKNQFVPTAKGQKFGPSWYTHWFKVQIAVPEEWVGNEVIFHWDCENEGMVFDTDGRVIVGLSGEERQEFILPAAMQKGVQTFYIETSCNGMFGNADPSYNILPPMDDRYFTLRAADLVLPRQTARALKRDYEVIMEAAKIFPESSWQKHKAIEVANEIIDTFDRTDLENSLQKCREVAQKFLGPNVDSSSIYTNYGTLADEPVVAVGHCHIDTAWLWPYAETRRKIARSWSSQLDLMERYPEYKFVCSQAVQYQWLKEDYPELFERLKVQVANGRFIPIGGSWVESDTNLPSGESIARQFYYGQKFFMEQFGIKCKTFWLPDTFGYSAQIPQLTRLAEMERFITQKLSWNNINTFPNTTFNWVALDGSQVLCHMPPADTYNSDASLREVQKTVENHRNTGIDKSGLLVFGFGDGGGGPTADMIERLRRARGVADTVGHVPKVQIGASVDQFFDRIEQQTDNTKKLVTWMGELYFEFHRGTYTSQARTKRGNRDCEVLLHDLEFLCSLVAAAEDSKYHYPKGEIEEMWKLVLLNQFHDVLPGSSIEMVYNDAEELYLEVETRGRKLFDEAVQALGGIGSGSIIGADTGVYALNTLPWSRNEVVEVSDQNLVPCVPRDIVQAAQDFNSSFALFTSSESGIMSIQDISTTGSSGASAKQGKKKGEFVLQNEKLRATILDGHVVSLVDLDQDREIIEADSKANQYVVFEDQPLNWQGWDTEVYSNNKRKEVPPGSVRVLEEGPLRAAVLVEQQISDKSWIKTTISLDAFVPPSGNGESGAVGSYLEFNAEVEWNEDCQFLKVEFPVDIHNEFASYDSMFGMTRRPTHYNTFWDVAKFEVCCHKYADLSEETYGVTLLNDSKYGFSTHGHVMRLSMLRAPRAPDAHADLGRHNIRYAILGHKGRIDGNVVRTAYNFNQPLRLFPALNHFEPTASLDTITYQGPQSVVLSNVKPSEDGSKSLVVRLYDSLGGKTTGYINSKYKLKSVTKVNLLENDVEQVKVEHIKDSGSRFKVNLRAFEIASYKLHI